MDYVTREQWNMIFAHTSEAIFFVNEKELIESMNPAAEQLTGFSQHEAVGKFIYDYLRIDPKSEVSLYSYLSDKEGLERQELDYLEFPIIQKNGEQVWISCSFTKIGTENDHKIVIFARNINESKKVEQMRSDFISIASHELRTPLTVIAGYLSLLLGGKVGKLTDKQENFVKQIYDDTQSLSSLVEDLLDVSRLDTGKFRLHKTPLSLGDIVRKTIDSLNEKALERNITIVYTINKNVPAMHGDKAKLRQVITNIIDNAIKYTNPGGKIRVDLRYDAQSFILTVTDTGYGIEKKDLPHIFERFYRAENKLLDRVTGAGLGLYISKTIIEMHDGTIIADSAIEKGTTFTITLPRDPIFEDTHEVEKQEKVSNSLQQFLSQFLHGRRRKDYTYE